jgi:hypothetical protein
MKSSFMVTDGYPHSIFPFLDSIALGIDDVIRCRILGTALQAKGWLSQLHPPLRYRSVFASNLSARPEQRKCFFLVAASSNPAL